MNVRGIQNGMAVYSSDGEKLGKVVSCDADGFLVEKGIFFPKEHFIRYDHAASVSGDEIRLSLARDQLDRAGEARRIAPPIEREHETYAGAFGASERREGELRAAPEDTPRGGLGAPGHDDDLDR